MFLANSLNEKLKRSLSQFDIINSNQKNKLFIPHQQNPKVLYYNQLEYSNNEEGNELNYDNDYSLYKLHKKWERKWNLNYEPNYKKFSSDCTSEKVKESKAYIKDLLDPDIFENKKPRWNISNKVDEKFRTPLKKTIFEFENGLNSFLVVPLKEKNIPEGIDSRYEPSSIDKINWNISNKINEKEINEINDEERIKDFYNTQKYWKKYENNREKGAVFQISEERKKLEEPRNFKPYKDPKTLITYHYNTMNKVKQNLLFEREKIEKEIKSEFPEVEKYKEKIDYLVDKKMYNKYKKQFEILIGKKKEKNNENKTQNNWKDEEIVDKIQTISDWKNIKWFKPNNKIMSDKRKKIELLKCLVKDCKDVKKEENKKKEEIEKKKKKTIRMELLKKKTNKKKLVSNKNKTMLLSKYPIDKNFYDFNMKIFPKNLPYSNSALNIYNTSNQINNENIEKSEKEIFLEAYKNVILKEEKKNKKRCLSGNINNSLIEYHYYHPGVYRQFIEKKIQNESSRKNSSNEGSNSKRSEIEELIYAWSCCLNRDRFSKGCSCNVIKRRKWNYDCA